MTTINTIPDEALLEYSYDFATRIFPETVTAQVITKVHKSTYEYPAEYEYGTMEIPGERITDAGFFGCFAESLGEELCAYVEDNESFSTPLQMLKTAEERFLKDNRENELISRFLNRYHEEISEIAQNYV